MSSEADFVELWIESCQFSYVPGILASFMFLILFCQFCHILLTRTDAEYAKSDRIKQYKVLVYLANIVYRIVALLGCLYLWFEFWDIENGVFVDKCFGIKTVQIMSIEYSTLMIFELIRLPELTWDMWVHHLALTLVAMTLMDDSILNTQYRTDPYYVETTLVVITGASLLWVCLKLILFVSLYFFIFYFLVFCFVFIQLFFVTKNCELLATFFCVFFTFRLFVGI